MTAGGCNGETVHGRAAGRWRVAAAGQVQEVVAGDGGDEWHDIIERLPKQTTFKFHKT